MDHPSFSLDHRLRELRDAARDRRLPIVAGSGPSVVSALRDRLGTALVAAGETLQTSAARRTRGARAA
jgi:hypothetical protein